jgi:putative ABC transport system permease protein
MLAALFRNLIYALRCLRASPGFALTALLSLAIGCGAATAVFQVFDALRLRSLPVSHPEQLAELRITDMTHARGGWLRPNAVTNPIWERIRDRQDIFSGAFAWADISVDLGASGERRAAAALWVSGSFFRVLGVRPALGRLFTDEDDHRGCGIAPGAVISYGFWQREFGGAASALRQTVRVGGFDLPVLGVAQSGFPGLVVGQSFDAALPLCEVQTFFPSGAWLDSGVTWWLTVMGRLKPGVNLRDATARIATRSPSIFEGSLPAGYPQASVQGYLSMKLAAIPAARGLSELRERYSRPLLILLGITALTLLIGCSNLAGLMLARAGARGREMAIRLALGARRGDLISLIIAEGALISVAGATLGLVISKLLSGVLARSMGGPAGAFVDLRLDLPVFAFAAGVAAMACLLFAAVPAVAASGSDPAEALKSGGRTLGAGAGGFTLRRTFAVAQVAISMSLLGGGFLLIETLRNLLTFNPGFDPHGVLIAEVNFRNLHLSRDRIAGFRSKLMSQIRAIPDVESASETGTIPLTGQLWDNRMWLDGSPPASARVIRHNMVGAAYFRTIRSPLLTGREFDDYDLQSASQLAVVNQSFLRAFGIAGNAVGTSFWVEATPFAPQSAYRIVGVVKDSSDIDLREPMQPVAFFPLWQQVLDTPVARLLIRSRTTAEAMTPEVRAVLGSPGAGLTYLLSTYDSRIEASLVRERLMARVSAIFGLVVAALTMVGLFGAVSYSVARRTGEIGIRIALGSSRGLIAALILREAAVTLVLGLVAGTTLFLAAGRALRSLLFGVAAQDPIMLAAGAGTVTALVAIAGLLPALRAARIDPLKALRTE